MMREILFRGKDNSGVLNHSWCFGSLDTTLNEQPTIIYPDRFGNRCKIIVKEHTIGQYTGLTDKNGKEIFEGDICSKFGNYSGKKFCFLIVFEQGLFYAKYSETVGMPLCDICEKIEIIGNIHDNPELLKGGELDHPTEKGGANDV